MLDGVHYERELGSVAEQHVVPDHGHDALQWRQGSAGSNHTAFRDAHKTAPCFTPGTLIATPLGEVPVEDLRPGDRVITRDSGLQKILWTGRRDLAAQDLQLQPQLCPVRIAAGALGHGLPERDLLISPNHRILIRSPGVAEGLHEEEVLVAAQNYLFRDGFTREAPSEVGYIHLLFERHEILLSNGAWTESFRPGPVTLGGMERAQRDEILQLFPELEPPRAEGQASTGPQGQSLTASSPGQSYPAARRILEQHEVQMHS
ncbi:Hint domain-containing protein [Pseudooceanicola sp. HF7]|uniref:Hint domain-containing protein n=1 Tax=Pseudooceanicola sp. HF7 TaxID=2721560 RepID=UPI0014320330|nr:Hint domain-containing protein [Pseudooceanicola sp. HF7]NIZ10348.1 Hint domain-containing protein [Pseudooceanicola sp. HF7]